MSRSCALVCLVSFAGLAPAPPPPKPVPAKTDKDLIIGVWKRIETTQMDTSDLFLWFDDKGVMKVNRKLDGTGWGYLAKYGIKDKELPYESTDPGFPHKETLKVLKLTDDEFEYEDPMGIREKYKRTQESPKK